MILRDLKKSLTAERILRLRSSLRPKATTRQAGQAPSRKMFFNADMTLKVNTRLIHIITSVFHPCFISGKIAKRIDRE